MDISNVHCGNALKQEALRFSETVSKENFELFYKNHFVEETLEEFNLTVETLRLVRKIFDINCMPKRVKPKKSTVKHFLYNNGVKEIMIKADETVPDGFVRGRKPFSAETREKIAASRKGRIPINKNKKYYTNGVETILLGKDDTIPEGFLQAARL